MNEVTLIEENLFGDDRLIEVEYRLLESDLEIVAVRLFKEVYWNENGVPAPHHVSVDVLSVLYCWQVQDLADKVLEALKNLAEQERLAA